MELGTIVMLGIIGYMLDVKLSRIIKLLEGEKER